MKIKICFSFKYTLQQVPTTIQVICSIYIIRKPIKSTTDYRRRHFVCQNYFFRNENERLNDVRSWNINCNQNYCMLFVYLRWAWSPKLKILHSYAPFSFYDQTAFEKNNFETSRNDDRKVTKRTTAFYTVQYDPAELNIYFA